MRGVAMIRSSIFVCSLAWVIGLAADLPVAGAQQSKPRVPSGIDPGGIAVAIVAEGGIDYTLPAIAARIARDGEGELIGWDFVDNDRRPFGAAVTSASTNAIARLLLVETRDVRIAPFRVIPSDKLVLGRAAVYVARSPARIALVTVSTAQRADWDAFSEVLAHFKDLLFIVPAQVGAASFPAGLELANLISVADLDGLDLRPVPSHQPADLAVPGAGSGPAGAAARLTALAARLSASQPDLAGAALKAQIVSLAKPLPAAQHGATRHGRIDDPLGVSISRR